MRARTAVAAAILVAMAGGAPAAAETCADKDGGLGVARVVEIDTSTGPLFGDMSKFSREASFLGPKEVVLTFDDGPLAPVTKPILETLDKFCTKATFFSVGRMALAFPDLVKDIIARGHTFGGHTWSHANLRAAGSQKAIDEIERGFAAMTLAAGQPVAPFFRFPYLNDSNPLLGHLQQRGIAAFTVDVVSNDSYIGSPQRLIDHTMRDTIARDGGIMLFHDIKSVTAKALPEILSQLKERGFKVVHMRPKAGYTPMPEYQEQLAAMLAKSAQAKAGKATKPGEPGATHALIPFTAGLVPETGSLSVTAGGDGAELPVTVITPTAKSRAPAPVVRTEQLATHSDEDGASSHRPGKPRTHSRTKRHRPPANHDEPKRFFD